MNWSQSKLSIEDMQKVDDAVKNNLVNSLLRNIDHPTCIQEINFLVEKIENLKMALDQLIKQNNRLITEGRFNPKREVKTAILKDPRKLLEQLRIQNKRLRQEIRMKFDQASASQPAEPTTKVTIQDILPDKKQQQIKLLKISIAQAEDRLNRYRLRVNPKQIADAEKEHLMLIQQAVQMSLNTGTEYSQVPVRGYPQLTTQNRKLVDELRKKSHLIQELKKTVKGYGATETLYDIENNQMQRNIQDVMFHERMNPQHIAKEKLRIRSLQLLDEKMRLHRLIESGEDIRQEANGYFIGRNKIGLVSQLTPVPTTEPLLHSLI